MHPVVAVPVEPGASGYRVPKGSWKKLVYRKTVKHCGMQRICDTGSPYAEHSCNPIKVPSMRFPLISTIFDHIVEFKWFKKWNSIGIREFHSFPLSSTTLWSSNDFIINGIRLEFGNSCLRSSIPGTGTRVQCSSDINTILHSRQWHHYGTKTDNVFNVGRCLFQVWN